MGVISGLIDRVKEKESNVKNEVLSGLTVALALVPEAVAFSLIAGVSPLIGLYSAFFIGIITALLGGRPGMISGATGAIAVVVVSLVATHGVEYLFAAVVVMGLIQILVGVLKLGKFIRMVPHSVMFGFVNGLAIVIFMAQLTHFKNTSVNGAESWLTGVPMVVMVGFVILTMAIIYLLPKITKAIPAPLTAILVVSAIIIAFGIETKTVGDIASIKGGLPKFHLPKVPLSFETLKIVFPYSLIMAMVGLIESLLTLTVIDEMTETRGRGNKESVAQGLANLVCGFFSGMGGCAMIGQSIINVSSGARKKLSTIVAPVTLLMFILFGSSLIERVPMAALVGVMFMVSVGTFEWASLKMFRNMPLSDVIVMLTVALVTVFFHNLAVAVFIGIIISALVFAWQHATNIHARPSIDKDGNKVYEVDGPLFFASVSAFNDRFDVKNDPEIVIIDFMKSRVLDHSAIEALNKLTEKYASDGKKVLLRHLSSDSRELLDNASAIIEVNYLEDPKYKVASNKLA